ncbi:MAG: L,D-transpeptidase family protein [Sulfuricurvum sp.]|nr:L,D-transpeptidase family protein [Sulfuricurvum sp.]
MIKKFFIFFIVMTFSSVWGHEQLVVVLSPEQNSTAGWLQRYEKEVVWHTVGEPVHVTLGRSGLGWAEGYETLKMEGDGRSPAGVFPITSTFGYDPQPNSTMPYFHADEKLICVDDVNDSHYNKMALLNPQNPPKSYEVMRRSDGVYRHGAIIDYNPNGISGRGSCIFFHLNKTNNTPTSGCTAMDEKPLLEMLSWLDPEKKPRLLQVPRSECEKYQKEFVGIECR